MFRTLFGLDTNDFLPTADELTTTAAVAFFVCEFLKPTADVAVECELEQMNTLGLFDLVLVTAAVTTAGGSVKLLLFELGWSELNVVQWVAKEGTLFFTLLKIADELLTVNGDVSRSREAERKRLRALTNSADANLLLVVSDSDLERDNSHFGI